MFESSVEGKQDDTCIINKEEDTGVRLSYTKYTLSADSQRGIRICHSVTFNDIRNAAHFYATVYGLSDWSYL